MKILHIIGSIDPSKGGVSSCVASIAAAMARHGHSVGVVFPKDNGFDYNISTLFEALPQLKEVKMLGIPSKNSFIEYFMTRSSPTKLLNIVADYDIVHLHGVWCPIVIRAGLLCRTLKRPYVICPHGMLNEWSLAQKKYKKKLAMRLVVKSIFTKAAVVHVLNKYEKIDIGKVMPGVKMKIFPNGIFSDQPNSDRDHSYIHFSNGFSINKPYIVFLGRLHYKKGIDFLMDAFKLLSSKKSDISLVIVGPDDGMGSFIEKFIRENELNGRVFVLGPAYGEKKNAVLRNALCFVHPSRSEGFSMAIVEAMVCGVPVVISEGCNFPEIVEHNAGYVVTPTSDALANALELILSDEIKRKEMGKRAKQFVLNYYTWDKITQAMIDLYRQMLKEVATKRYIS